MLELGHKTAGIALLLYFWSALVEGSDLLDHPPPVEMQLRVYRTGDDPASPLSVIPRL